MEHKQTEPIILNTDESQGIVEAIWAVMGNRDSQGDVIHPGAFKKTFSERGSQVVLLDNHQTHSIMSALGTVLELKELGKGELPAHLTQQYPEATGAAWGRFQFLLDTPEGKGAFTRIKNKAVQKWSFGYDSILRDHGNIEEDGRKVSVRNLRELKLYEVSPVLFPANSATITTGVKSQEEEAPTEEKAGRVLSARNAQRIMAAVDELRACMMEAGLMDEPMEEMSNNGATGPQKSEEPPTSDGLPSGRHASEAGPAEDDSTRIKTLIQIEQEALKMLEVNNWRPQSKTPA